MRRIGRLLACLALIGASTSLGAGSALADSNPNCSGSAGDSQYVDPLACPTTSTPKPPPATTPQTTPSPPATPPVTVPVATTSTAASPDPHHELAFTGFDVWPAIALGAGFVAAGIVLRRRSHTS